MALKENDKVEVFYKSGGTAIGYFYGINSITNLFIIRRLNGANHLIDEMPIPIKNIDKIIKLKNSSEVYAY